MDAKKAVHKHEANMHPSKTPTKFSKGGTTGMQMKKGGPTGQQMRAVGRNMARANNQK
jgi:hypothetical protein